MGSPTGITRGRRRAGRAVAARRLLVLLFLLVLLVFLVFLELVFEHAACYGATNGADDAVVHFVAGETTCRAAS